jgi:hypothetical protein
MATDSTHLVANHGAFLGAAVDHMGVVFQDLLEEGLLYWTSHHIRTHHVITSNRGISHHDMFIVLCGERAALPV